MRYAIDRGTGNRIVAIPGYRAICPLCRAEVVAKCGDINAWHWAHSSTEDCDSWSEGETSWHLDWKEWFQPEEREVVIGNHRADIRTLAGRVIELQHSPISAEEIAERERFYGSGMVWVVDASEFIDNLCFRDKGDHWTFRWKWPRKSWMAAKRPLYLDPGDECCWRGWLFRVHRVHSNVPCGGWGRWGDRAEFLRFYGAKIPTYQELMSQIAANRAAGKGVDHGTRPQH